MREAFQGTLSKPVRCEAIHCSRGRKYEQVQMNNKSTVSMLVKLKMADCPASKPLSAILGH